MTEEQEKKNLQKYLSMNGVWIDDDALVRLSLEQVRQLYAVVDTN